MAKYDALRQHLQRRSGPVSLHFSAISDMVPGGLPPSAFKHPAWWANETGGTHSHAKAWLDAGYNARADFSARVAYFDPR